MSDLPESQPPYSASFPKKTSLILAILAVVGVIALAGSLYWKFIYYPTTPQYALDEFFAAAKVKDYDKIYAMVQVPPAAKVLVRNGKDLKAMVARFPGLVPELEEYRISGVTISGDAATLDTTTKVKDARGLQTPTELHVKMVRTNGVWRVDGNWIMSEVSKKGLNGLLLNGTE